SVHALNTKSRGILTTRALTISRLETADSSGGAMFGLTEATFLVVRHSGSRSFDCACNQFDCACNQVLCTLGLVEWIGQMTASWRARDRAFQVDSIVHVAHQPE